MVVHARPVTDLSTVISREGHCYVYVCNGGAITLFNLSSRGGRTPSTTLRCTPVSLAQL